MIRNTLVSAAEPPTLRLGLGTAPLGESAAADERGRTALSS